jgi:hypothetical protein
MSANIMQTKGLYEILIIYILCTTLYYRGIQDDLVGFNETMAFPVTTSEDLLSLSPPIFIHLILLNHSVPPVSVSPGHVIVLHTSQS